MDEFTKSTAQGPWADFCGYRLPCGYCRALEKTCPMGNSQTYFTGKTTGQLGGVTINPCGSDSSVTMKRDVPSTPTVTAMNGGCDG